MAASAQVIAARTALMAEGLADPTRADLAEMALMGSEKAEAAAASAAILARHAGAMGGRAAEAAIAETRHALEAAAAVAAARTPAEAAEAQMRYALGWWGRAGAQWMEMNAVLTRAQAEAVVPIHETATANARRLKR